MPSLLFSRPDCRHACGVCRGESAPQRPLVELSSNHGPCLAAAISRSLGSSSSVQGAPAGWGPDHHFLPVAGSTAQPSGIAT
jgi:hypothetical protein